MILKRFNATDVFEHLNLTIDFDDELNFLIGPNGSGKTTALRLINLSFAFNIRTLLEFNFSKLEIDFIHENKKHNYVIQKNEKTITFKLTGHKSEEYDLFMFQRQTKSEWFSERERYIHHREKFNHRKKISDENSIRHTIRSLPKIQFLSLDRNVYSFDNASSKMHSSAKYFYDFDTEHNKNQQENKSYLLNSFLQSKEIIYEEIKKVNAAEKSLEHNLRAKFFSTSFDYIDGDRIVKSYFVNKDQKEVIIDKIDVFLKKKDEFIDLISNIFHYEPEEKNETSEQKTLEENLQHFFGSLEKALKKFNPSKKKNNNDDGLSIDLVANYGQIIRLEALTEIVNEYNTTRAHIYSRIDTFLTIINGFYKGSNKKVDIDESGEIQFISLSSGTRTLQGLSSGEMHLFVILSFLAFSHNTEKGNVLFIDEPEISLHLSWQDKLVQSLRQLNTHTQLILATHSPEIVSSFDDYCRKVVKS